MLYAWLASLAMGGNASLVCYWPGIDQGPDGSGYTSLWFTSGGSGHARVKIAKAYVQETLGWL
jgi:hypothetical protein